MRKATDCKCCARVSVYRLLLIVSAQSPLASHCGQGVALALVFAALIALVHALCVGMGLVRLGVCHHRVH